MIIHLFIHSLSHEVGVVFQHALGQKVGRYAGTGQQLFTLLISVASNLLNETLLSRLT